MITKEETIDLINEYDLDIESIDIDNLKDLCKSIDVDDAKEVFNLCYNRGLDVEEVLQSLIDEDVDFEDSGVRLIRESKANDILCDMHESDTYALGCFNAGFVSEYCDLDYEIVETLQEAGKHEKIGERVLEKDNLSEMMEDYVSADGYGHAFGSYDGNHEEVTLLGEEYIVFKV